MIYHVDKLGLLGLIANPLLRFEGVFSTFSASSVNSLVWTLVGGVSLIGWHGVTGVILFVSLERMGFLRVRAEAEIRGLDLTKHKGHAYGFGNMGSGINTPQNSYPIVVKNGSLNSAAVKNIKVEPLNIPEM